MKRLSILALLLIVVISLGGMQPVEDLIASLQKSLAVYRNAVPATNLYVHLDKNRYLTNESIWFKAYVLNGPEIANKVLFVRLTDKDKKVVLKYQCPVYDIRANGDMLLPDTLKEGEYYFYAYTSAMLNFNARQAFVQKIHIYKNAADNLHAEASVVDTTQLYRGGKVDVLVKVKKGLTYLTDAKCDYHLLINNITIKSGKVTTNFLGEVTIPFTYPQMPDEQSLRVKVSVAKDEDKASLDLNLRHEASPVLISAYPEGGHLIAGISNHLVVQATDLDGNALTLPLRFEQDGKLIAQAKTDRYGIAAMDVVPQESGHYYFCTPGNPHLKPIALRTAIEPAGFGLHVQQTGDIFYATIINKTNSDNATLVLRDRDNILWSQAIAAKQNQPLRLELPVNNIPKEILSLALFDAQGNCAAERLFMNKQAEHYKLAIQTDKTDYGKRKKVKVTINASDLSGNAMLANLSVAVTEQSRIDMNSYATILDSYYFKALETGTADPLFHGVDAAAMDALLITKKWWGNSWPQILSYQHQGQLRLLQNAGGVSGQIVKANGKPAGDIKQLSIYAKNNIVAVDVDKDGHFYIAPEYLTADPSERKYLVLGTDFYDLHNIRFENYDGEFDGAVKASGALNFLQPYNTLAKFNEHAGIDLHGSIQLKEVKIKDRMHSAIEQEAIFPVFKSQTCNDYVCIYNLLNCPWHDTGTTPVEGAIYSYKGHNVVYHGCDTKVADSNNLLLQNTSIPHLFILSDYDKVSPPEPELRSTIYWNPNLNTNTSGKAGFEFYTSDVSGDFTIVVQGIDGKTFRPVYATQTFKVK